MVEKKTNFLKKFFKLLWDTERDGFWFNFMGIIKGLPLILSDTQDPKDVSLNRVSSCAGFAIAFFILYEAIYVMPQYMSILMQFFAAVMAYLSAQMAGNIYKKSKGNEVNNNQNNQYNRYNGNYNQFNTPPNNQPPQQNSPVSPQAIENVINKLRRNNNNDR